MRKQSKDWGRCGTKATVVGGWQVKVGIPFSSGFLATSVAGGGGNQARSCRNGEAHGRNSEFSPEEPKEADWAEKFPK